MSALSLAEVKARPVLDVREAAEFLRVSPDSIYDSVARHEIPAVRLGRRVLVPVRPLLALLGIDSGGD